MDMENAKLASNKIPKNCDHVDIRYCEVCNQEIELMECPICNKHFPIEQIDVHASTCNDFESGFILLDKEKSDLIDWHVVDNEEGGYNSESENQYSPEEQSDEKFDEEDDGLVDDFIFLNGIDDADFVQLLDSTSLSEPNNNNNAIQTDNKALNNQNQSSVHKSEDHYFSEFVDHQKAADVLQSFQEVQVCHFWYKKQLLYEFKQIIITNIII
jgi:hypothetical protein